MRHAMVYTPQAKGLCPDMCTCDNIHQTGITSILVLILFNITFNISVKIPYLEIIFLPTISMIAFSLFLTLFSMSDEKEIATGRQKTTL